MQFVKFRWLSIIAAMLVSQAWGEDMSLERIKTAIEGNWRLEESHADGEVLHPPQADGRMSLHDGVIMISMHRDIQGTRKSNFGYGTYALTKDTWTLGYDRYAAFNESGAAITAAPAPFDGKRIFQIKTDGDKVIFDNDNGTWTFVFDGDAINYLGKGKPVRKWRRMRVE